MFSFELFAKEGDARAGRLITPHGPIETPSFVTVGTQAAVKAMSVGDLRKVGSQIIIVNAYHLHLQPGENLIEEVGGLHRFMGWNSPLMTDSGGFQIFSLGAAREHGVGKVASIFPEHADRGGHFKSKKRKPLVRIDEDGVDFISYLDGSLHRFTPRRVIDLQIKLGADIIFVLDECTSPLHDYQYTKEALKRTQRWALQALDEFHHRPNKSQALMGIVQGGAYQDLREQCAQFISEQGFDGYAIGGSLGKSKMDMCRVLEWTIPILPQKKPRHLLGIGEIEDIFEIIQRGIDLIDCVLPTRMANTGTLFVKDAKHFRVHIYNMQFKDDPRPVELGCVCYTCRHYSRAYLRHLFMAKEPLATHLATIHNLYFIESLMKQIRVAIKERGFKQLKKEWLYSS